MIFDSNSSKLCDMSNEAFLAWLWLIERRYNESILTITGRRLYCRRQNETNS